MRHLVVKDKHLRFKFKKIEQTSRIYSFFFNSQFILPTEKFFVFLKGRRISYFSRIHFRSVLTGRSRAIVKFFRVSRIDFRNNSLFGYYSGIRKSSWL